MSAQGPDDGKDNVLDEQALLKKQKEEQEQIKKEKAELEKALKGLEDEEKPAKKSDYEIGLEALDAALEDEDVKAATAINLASEKARPKAIPAEVIDTPAPVVHTIEFVDPLPPQAQQATVVEGAVSQVATLFSAPQQERSALDTNVSQVPAQAQVGVVEQSKVEEEKQVASVSEKTQLLQLEKIEAIKQFNARYKNGIEYLKDDLGKSPQEIGQFLAQHSSELNIEKLGECLGDGDPVYVAILEEYARNQNLQGVEFVDGLREFLQKFKLPTEGQKIVRISKAFGNAFHEKNANHPHITSPTIAAKLFSYCMMLNATTYNPQVKKADKLTSAQFKDYFTSEDECKNVDKGFLESIYKNITTNEIKLKTKDKEQQSNIGPESGVKKRTPVNVVRDIKESVISRVEKARKNKSDAKPKAKQALSSKVAPVQVQPSLQSDEERHKKLQARVEQARVGQAKQDDEKQITQPVPPEDVQVQQLAKAKTPQELFSPSQNPSGINLLVDFDETLELGAGGGEERAGLNVELLNAWKAIGIKEIYILSSMEIKVIEKDAKARAQLEKEGSSRQAVFAQIEKEWGIKVKGVLTTEDLALKANQERQFLPAEEYYEQNSEILDKSYLGKLKESGFTGGTDKAKEVFIKQYNEMVRLLKSDQTALGQLYESFYKPHDGKTADNLAKDPQYQALVFLQDYVIGKYYRDNRDEQMKKDPRIQDEIEKDIERIMKDHDEGIPFKLKGTPQNVTELEHMLMDKVKIQIRKEIGEGKLDLRADDKEAVTQLAKERIAAMLPESRKTLLRDKVSDEHYKQEKLTEGKPKKEAL